MSVNNNKRNNMKTIGCAVISVVLAIAGLALVSCQANKNRMVAQLHLAGDGRTDYALVKPSAPTEVDEYAISTLTNFLL